PKFKAVTDAPPEAPLMQKIGCPAVPSGQTMTVANGEYALHVSGWSMEVLANQLAYLVRAHVTDATGLTGSYEIAMCWAPDTANPVAADRGPTLEQAVQDQLGLRLAAKKGPVEFVVVDGAEKVPAGN